MLRFKEKETYKQDDLVYAAEARCPCGAGLAHPKGCGSHHYWDCSAILLGKAKPKDDPGTMRHTDRLPFVFWKVTSEESFSDRSTTTRPEGRYGSAASGSSCDYPDCTRTIQVDETGMSWEQSRAHHAWVLRQQGWVVWQEDRGAHGFLCPDHADKAAEMRERFPLDSR